MPWQWGFFFSPIVHPICALHADPVSHIYRAYFLLFFIANMRTCSDNETGAVDLFAADPVHMPHVFFFFFCDCCANVQTMKRMPGMSSRKSDRSSSSGRRSDGSTETDGYSSKSVTTTNGIRSDAALYYTSIRVFSQRFS